MLIAEKACAKIVLRRGIQTLIVVALSFQAGRFLTSYVYEESALFASMWSMVSGILVLQDGWSATKKAGFQRVLGATIGAGTCAVYMLFFPVDVYGLAISAAIATMIAIVCRAPDGGRGAAVTVVIVMIVAAVNPQNNPSIGAGLRFLEACFGTVAALLVSFVWCQVYGLLKRASKKQSEL